jgi:hypothetical protein
MNLHGIKFQISFADISTKTSNERNKQIESKLIYMLANAWEFPQQLGSLIFDQVICNNHDRLRNK